MPYGLGALPPTFDPRDHDYHLSTLALPPVKAVQLPVQAPLPPWHPLDQNGYGTCTAEATLLALVVAYHKKTGIWLYANAAEAQHAAQALYVEATGDHTLGRGAELRTLMKAAQKTGIVTPAGGRVKAASYHCLLPSADVRGAIESAIAAGMIVVTAWRWPQVWMTTRRSTRTPTRRPTRPWRADTRSAPSARCPSTRRTKGPLRPSRRGPYARCGWSGREGSPRDD